MTDRTNSESAVVDPELLAHVRGEHRDQASLECRACGPVTREHAFRAAQNAVRNQGYAVALHGSEIRDLDLVAIPWRETAISAQRCAEMIAKAIPGVLVEPVEEKPYGRLAWEIHPLKSAGHQWGYGFDHWYIDLSVMPRMETWKCEGCGATTGRYDNGDACETCVMQSFGEAG